MVATKYNLDLNKVYETDFQVLYYIGKGLYGEKHFLYGIREEKPPFIYVEDNGEKEGGLEKEIRKILPDEVDEFIEAIILDKEGTLKERMNKYLNESTIYDEYEGIKDIIEKKELFKEYMINRAKEEEI